MSRWRPNERKWRPQYSHVCRMESMDTPPRGGVGLVGLEPRGAGALKTGLVEDGEEEDEQWGKECGGRPCGPDCGGRPGGGVRWGVLFLEGPPRRFFRRRGARPHRLALSSSPPSESLASECETGEDEGERDQEGVT